MSLPRDTKTFGDHSWKAPIQALFAWCQPKIWLNHMYSSYYHLSFWLPINFLSIKKVPLPNLWMRSSRGASKLTNIVVTERISRATCKAQYEESHFCAPNSACTSLEQLNISRHIFCLFEFSGFFQLVTVKAANMTYWLLSWLTRTANNDSAGWQ